MDMAPQSKSKRSLHWVRQTHRIYFEFTELPENLQLMTPEGFSEAKGNYGNPHSANKD